MSLRFDVVRHQFRHARDKVRWIRALRRSQPENIHRQRRSRARRAVRDLGDELQQRSFQLIEDARVHLDLFTLLLKPPPAALVHNLDDPTMRATWPLSDDHTRQALEALSDGAGELGAIRFDYERLFQRAPAISLHTAPGRPEAVKELRELYRRDKLSVAGSVDSYDDHLALQILYIADRAAEGAHASAIWVRETYLDPAIEPILAAIRERAATPLFKAVPGLVRGFLDEHRRACHELNEQ